MDPKTDGENHPLENESDVAVIESTTPPKTFLNEIIESTSDLMPQMQPIPEPQKDKNKRPTIIGNWKMHKDLHSAKTFVENLMKQFPTSHSHLGLAVPFTMIQPLAELTKGSTLMIGAQNMNDASEGAFTGEVAASMLKEAGAKFVLIGHSERRRIFKEDNAFINKKIKKALQTDLKPILCVGETKAEFDKGITNEVIENQLKECLADVNLMDGTSIIIAYEPVWAIGTGETASPEQAQQAHHVCRKVIQDIFNEKIANEMTLLYGGSVNEKNAKNLLIQQDINGLLVGGASLLLDSFGQIIYHSESLI